MNDWTASQIREIVNVEIAGERRLRDELRKEDHRAFEAYKRNMADALALQAKEYERRLADLNHAHAEAQRVFGTYIPREVYERAMQELATWRNQLDLKAADLESRVTTLTTGVANLPGGIRSIEVGLAAQAAQSTGSRMTMTTAIILAGTFIAAAGLIIGLLNHLAK